MTIDYSTAYNQVVNAIIKHQESIIGPIAWSEAKEVPGITLNNNTVVLIGNGKKILELLVNQYKNLFGQASVEVCKDALKESRLSLPASDLPEILR